MAGRKLIAICMLGGVFESNNDGLSYSGGDAHAMEIDGQMKYSDIQAEISEMFNCNPSTISIKYFLPGNRRTLISIANDKDLERMIKFHHKSSSIEIYVKTEETVVPDASNVPASRSSRTTLSEPEGIVNATPCVLDDVGDERSQPALIGATFDVTNAITKVNDQTDISSGMPVASPYSSRVSTSAEKHTKAACQWQNNITGVGQRFNSVIEFREALRKYSIAHQFSFLYKKNDSDRVTVKCKAEGCPWRIHASRLSSTQLICIKKMNPDHTCEGSGIMKGYKATRSWVASIIKEKLKTHPDYKPKDIVTDIKQDFGIQLNYFQAWRGKEIAKEELQGSYKEAYHQLPYFCERIMETNPGSLATYTTKDDTSFHRLFVSFHASLYGFKQGCRPLLFLNSAPLKSKYRGTILAATAADGNDSIFPVAFAVVDTEIAENWSWFLLNLKTVLSTCQGITVVSDREKGLKESIAEIFGNENVYHGYCIRYLSEQFIRDLRGRYSNEVKRLMVEDLHAAAYAPKPEGFQRCVDSIKGISDEAYGWVVQSEPIYWANAFFQGARYNHITSDFGELFYLWASEAHELPITQMVDAIRGKIMELFYTRRTDSSEWLTRLTPFAEEKLREKTLKARELHVSLSASNRFEVRGDTVEVVNINNLDCSCRQWHLTGLPCCHAIGVISCLGRDPYDYCARYFTTESYRLTYSESINPIPNVDKPVPKGKSTVTPPPTRRPPGRPSSKKDASHEASKRRQLQCSRCKSTGHNKSTCQFLEDCQIN